MQLDYQLDRVNIGTLNIFCVAAELESFVLTAEKLGLTPATVSRSISRLEARLGVKLFARNTRQVKLTEVGDIYYQSCLVALQRISETEHDLIRHSAHPKGRLRISLPTTYAYYRLMPILVAFQRTYPNIQLEMDISNTNIDFIAQGFDLSVRLGEVKDSRLVALKLEDAKLGIFAATSYLQKYGSPQSFADLASHQCIQFIMPNSGRALPWEIMDNGVLKTFTPETPVYLSGDVLGAIRFANAGGGIFQTYDFIAKHDDNANLVEVLSDLKGSSRPFHLIYPYSKYLPNKLRVFIDFLKQSEHQPLLRN